MTMNKLWNFIKRDARKVTANVISMVVCMGMIVIPSFYAWFNIAGSWDPYANTSQLNIALANSDEGYSSSLIPVKLNIGEEVVSELRSSESIGYHVTSEDEAIEGVKSGKYYAVIVIPQGFSADLMTVLSSEPRHPEVLFYTNKKENAIASIVTNKASTAAQTTINESFANAVVNVGASTLSDIGDYLDDDQAKEVARKLEERSSQTAQALRQTSNSLNSFADLTGSVDTLLGNSSNMMSSSFLASLDAESSLRSTTGDITELKDALSGAQTSMQQALDSSLDSVDSVGEAIDDAFDVTNQQSERIQTNLGDAKARVQTISAKIGEKSAETQDAIDSVQAVLDSIPDDGSLLSTTLRSAVERPLASLQSIKRRLDSAVERLDNLSNKLQATADVLSKDMSDANTAHDELKQAVLEARAALDQSNNSWKAGLNSQLDGMQTKLTSAAQSADTIGSDVQKTLDSLSATTGSARTGLKEAQASLRSAAQSLDSSASKLEDLDARVAAALGSNDMQQVRAVLSADATDLAAFISEPVNVNRHAVFPVENNGSAMAPFYTTLAIWIGGVVLCALVKVTASKSALEETGAKPRHAYFGRLVFFLVIGFLQSSLVLLGDLYFLHIQCEHPVLFLLAGWFSSVVFINIIYALTAAFGDVGKAIAVVLMVIQVAGSGGTFPVQMLPAPFQTLYPFLPFVHAEGALRAAIAGLWQMDFYKELGYLALYLIPALILGLLLKKPVERLNERVEHALSQTKFM